MTINPPSGPASVTDSDLLTQAIRMVTPLRREFGRSLDVPHFLHDFAYAKEVVAQASTSENERLRDYANYFNTHLIGARLASASASPAAAAPPPSPAATATASERQDGLSVEEELRQRMLKKYSSGVR